ncbi:helix-turn-helix domain-containing protein [Thermoactinomyces sp. CICC 23799]|jgi:excisionase family DNA binding protein|uniref:helix-turn-helix domain-containing protein n=1 Tax=Thermoactinomyces TaxID=2023 RepID=UPI0018DEB3E5|nr:helix-turn-helix domain-containing protein [Thermoactinomyces sp. CICC 23799]MBH8600121.1 helix-turn-helix domain-containing protein [Thermoactinomyces sp. CICC 23799]
MKELNKLLTPKEVAELLQVSEVTVKKWLRAGRLRGFKVNRLWRVSAEDLEDFIKSSS